MNKKNYSAGEKMLISLLEWIVFVQSLRGAACEKAGAALCKYFRPKIRHWTDEECVHLCWGSYGNEFRKEAEAGLLALFWENVLSFDVKKHVRQYGCKSVTEQNKCIAACLREAVLDDVKDMVKRKKPDVEAELLGDLALRVRRRRRDDHIDDRPDDELLGLGAPDAGLERIETRETRLSLLRRLSERQRDAVYWICVSDYELTVKEYAHMRGISERAVYSLLDRAAKKLTACEK